MVMKLNGSVVASAQEVLDNRKQWEDALSGDGPRKYRQHRCALASSSYQSFCCLGVAAEAVTDLKLVRVPGGHYYRNDRDERVSGGLTVNELKLLGLTGEMQDYLVRLNDVRHVPLKIIGAVLRMLPVINPDSDAPIESRPFVVGSLFSHGSFDHHAFEADSEVASLLKNYQKDYVN